MASHCSSNTSTRINTDLPVLPSFSEFLSENGIASDFSDHTAYHIKRTWTSSPKLFTQALLSSSTPHGHAPLYIEPIPIFPIRSRDPAASQPYSVSQAQLHDRAGVLKPSPVLQHVHDDHPPEHRDASLTKAGNPRKRSERACTRCRELKVKCEPSNPICSHCWRRGYTCDLASR